MRKARIAVFIVAICIVLCACGRKSEPEPMHGSTPIMEPTPNPAEILFDDPDTGDAPEDGKLEENDEVVEVEITMDNLMDYFEIVKDRTEKKDSKGKLYYLFISRRLALKKEYTLAEWEEYPTDVSVGFEYDSKFVCYRKPCTIDFKTFKVTGKVWSQDKTHESQIAHFPFSPLLDCYWADSGPSSKDTPSVVSTSSNFKFLTASGKLYLISK